MRLVLDQGPGVAQWVEARIPHMNGQPFGPSSAIGVVTDQGVPIAGVVFHDYQPQYGAAMISVASDTPRWLTKRLITGIMRVPFNQYKLNRLTAITPPGEISASQFLTKFGFRREGVVRLGLGNQDAVIWGLLATDWKWSRFNLDRAVSRGEVNSSASRRSRPHRRRRRAERSEHRDGAGTTTPQPSRH